MAAVPFTYELAMASLQPTLQSFLPRSFIKSSTICLVNSFNTWKPSRFLWKFCLCFSTRRGPFRSNINVFERHCLQLARDESHSNAYCLFISQNWLSSNGITVEWAPNVASRRPQREQTHWCFAQKVDLSHSHVNETCFLLSIRSKGILNFFPKYSF